MAYKIEEALTLRQAMTVIAALADAMEKLKPAEEPPVRASERAIPALRDARAFLPDVRALAQLPVIGGSAFDEKRIADLIGSDRFQSRYERGQTVSLYVAANEGFRTVGRTMRAPVFKIGLCSPERLHERQLELDRDGYGSLFMRDGELVQDPGFGAWDLLRMPQDLRLLPNSPVAAGERDLRITLPRGLQFPHFDALLTAALKPASLTFWAGSPSGRRYCNRHKIDVATLLRFTAYEFGTASRVSPATELMIVRPKAEIPRLVAMVEGIIADWVQAEE